MSRNFITGEMLREMSMKSLGDSFCWFKVDISLDVTLTLLTPAWEGWVCDVLDFMHSKSSKSDIPTLFQIHHHAFELKLRY